MSTLNTLANPSAAVVVSGIIAFVAHRLGKLKIGSATLAEDVAKEWPAIKDAADLARSAAKAVPGLSGQLVKVSADVQRVEGEVKSVTGFDPASIAPAVEAEVQKQLAGILAAAAKTPQP